MRVLMPREMIELYVGDENVDADHIDFKKALDLLDYVTLDDEEKQTIWLHIWCRSIMRNTWTKIDKDNPLESVFFRPQDDLDSRRRGTHHKSVRNVIA